MVTINHKAHNGGAQALLERVTAMKNRAVYVGVPAEKTSRTGAAELTNAELLYIHTHGVRRSSMRREMQPSIDSGTLYSKAFEMYVMAHGSPLWQSPPRPVIEPAIEFYHKEIAEQFSKAISAGMNGNAQAAARALIRTGMLAQNYCRGWFVNPANHWPPNSPKTIKLKGSDRPLIDTGALRKSIIYVIDDNQDRGVNDG